MAKVFDDVKQTIENCKTFGRFYSFFICEFQNIKQRFYFVENYNIIKKEYTEVGISKILYEKGE